MMNNSTTIFTSDGGYQAEAYLDNAGVWRWASNDRIPFDDMLIANNVPADVLARCQAARSAENAAFIAEYRRTQTAPSAEELYEMRAAFGPGKVIVDVISGRRVQL